MFIVSTIIEGFRLLQKDSENSRGDKEVELSTKIEKLRQLFSQHELASSQYFSWFADSLRNGKLSQPYDLEKLHVDTPARLIKKFETLDRQIEALRPPEARGWGYTYTRLAAHRSINNLIEEYERQTKALPPSPSYQFALDLLSSLDSSVETISPTAAKNLGLDPGLLGKAAARYGKEQRS